ncbi:hypothetical protein GCM10011352_05020 [Marinobacterium zhoushanense]|uniref:HicA-like toxin of HicAB toxin-antitoxin system n=1 Tax=Marinobacterium zhoushanense TaxID=1679163 RepID=A0ABQ1JYI9_9GAMM|nr:hypothetical protein GCM10011352_05020 [Marinobacterium zhoushanense]
MRRYSSNKDWNECIKRLVKLGWIYSRGRKHGRLTHPDGSRILTVSNSPSDRRSLQNFMKHVD